MSDEVNGVSILAADTNSALKADLQYMEPYTSTALNRKLKNIIKPGVYAGFNPVPGIGLNVIITSNEDNGEGAASIDVNGVQISVFQSGDITVSVSAGATSIIALEANYKFGEKTTQVDSEASIEATQIFALVGATLSSNQIELCRVKVPANATQVTADMITYTNRVERDVGVVFSNDIDSDDEDKAATPLAVKNALSQTLFSQNNLSDLPDITEARENLKLGSAALKNIGVSGDSVPLLNTENTWDSVQKFAGGLTVTGGVDITGDATASGKIDGEFLASKTVLYASGKVDYLPPTQGATVGWNRTVGSGRIDLICHKGSGSGGLDIWNGNTNSQKLLATIREGLMVAVTPDTNSGVEGIDNYGPMVASGLNGRGSAHSAIENGAVFGVRIKEVVGSHHLGLFCLEGFGISKYWEMRSDGSFYSGGLIIAADEVRAGGGTSRMSATGNIYGSTWGGFLSDYLARTFVTAIRLGTATSVTAWNGPGYSDTSGHVLTGAINYNIDAYIDTLVTRPLQYCINNTWYTAESL